jgi:hypothetical protein
VNEGSRFEVTDAKTTENEMGSPERMGMGWSLWVVGWSLLVGGAAFVLPVFFVFGATGALWAGGVVVALSLTLGWLSAEAGRAVNADSGRVVEPVLAERATSKGR